MGTIIKASGVDAEQGATEFIPPVTRGLEGIFFLNSSREKASRNYAPGKPDGAIVGTPTINPSYINARSQSNYVQTEVVESEEVTIFCIARTTDPGSNLPTRAAWYGTYRNQGANAAVWNPGVSAWRDNGTFRANAGYGDDPAAPVQRQVVISAADFSAWSLYVHRVRAADVYFTDVTRGLSGSTSAIGARQRSVGKFRIGGVYYEFLGQCDVAVWQVHSVALNDQEIASIVANLRAYALKLGITV